MSILAVIFTFFLLLAVILLVVWWLRWTRRGLEWVTFFLFGALGLSHLSGIVFRAPPYQTGCKGLCPGWWGHPIATHHVQAGGVVLFDPASFVRNAFFYYAALLAFGAVAAWLGRLYHWSARSWLQRLFFLLAVIILPLAVLPLWAPPPQPKVSGPPQRLVINAARDWRWQLHLNGVMTRRLALEDVRLAPDGQHQRVCFRIYTWFYLPYARTYIDLGPEGVRALDGDNIPLAQSCWQQP